MKTERRHELQHNELADWLAGSVEAAKPYSRLIVGLCLAVAVVVGAIWFVSNRKAAKRAAGWNQYMAAFFQEGNLEGLRTTIDNHQGTPAAYWAQILIADHQYQQGVDSLFTPEREQGREQLKLAVENYSEVGDNADEPFVQQRAVFGLAKTLEALGDLEKSRAAYEQVVNKWPDSPLAGLAQRRLEQLQKPATQEFYTWLAAWTPPPPANTQGQTPAHEYPGDVDPQSAFDRPAGESTVAAPAGEGTSPAGLSSR